ncbi:hypothetical protein BN2127_JRS10_02463 [Bacillus subtilis]|nr:hypothetical protein BN2127_JRS10_02463 [Bacillus subtilis]
MIERAARNAVSPDVIGNTITPITAIVPPTAPNIVFEISLTTAAGVPDLINSFNSPYEKILIAAAAQIIAIIASAIIMPKNTYRPCFSV